jgi:hypothetical protein
MIGLGAAILFALGLVMGRLTTEPPRPDARPSSTATGVSVIAPPPAPRSRARKQNSAYPRTAEGAAAASAKYLAALGGPGLVDPAAMRRTLSAIASAKSRNALVRAYEAAAVRARDQLGVADASSPIVLRTASVGYRIDGFQRNVATVSIWRVGIVGTQPSLEPRQSWRTETVSLVWENGTWKVDAVRSVPGPTPPLASAANSADELFVAIPTFEGFSRELP